MLKHRFFAPVQDGFALLSAEDAYHARKVLRLRPSDELVIHDGEGYAYRGVVRDDAQAHFRVELYDRVRLETDPAVFCTLYLPWMKGERMEWAVQKAVELGVGQICVFAAERCVGAYNAARLERLRRIMREASRQSGAGFIAELSHENSFDAVLESKDSLKLMFDENAAPGALKDALAQANVPEHEAADSCAAYAQRIAVMTGPEGGFAPGEVLRAKQMGWKPVLLGRRILRCETAPIAALAAVFYHYEWS